jgi:hypothetical protein
MALKNMGENASMQPKSWVFPKEPCTGKIKDLNMD